VGRVPTTPALSHDRNFQKDFKSFLVYPPENTNCSLVSKAPKGCSREDISNYKLFDINPIIWICRDMWLTFHLEEHK